MDANPDLDVVTSIQDLEGSDGNDRLSGGGSDNGPLGRPGEDRLFGRAGDDYLQAKGDPPDADGVIDCGAGADTRTIDTLDPSPIDCSP
jgi:Ca2+-binding RTX toxin-like protein